MHDQTHRRIFSHPSLMRLLLEGFIDPTLIRDLDLDKMELMKDTFVSQGLSVRESDMVWRIARRAPHGSPLYIIVLLEFQSSVDWSMPVRIMQYTGLIYENILKQEHFKLKRRALPPILPIVLYNGRKRWSAPTELRDLIGVDPDSPLSSYTAALQFILVDEGRLPAPKLDALHNIIAQMFKLEQLQDASLLIAETQRFIHQLRAIFPQEAREDLARWLQELLRRFDLDAPLEPILAFKELGPMLSDAFDRLKLAQRNEGREEGREEGQLRARRDTLARLMALKFGPDESRLPAIQALSAPQLDRAIDLILSATDPDVLLAAARETA